MRRQEFSHDISACCCDISEAFSACACEKIPGKGPAPAAENACAAAGFNACRRTAFFLHGGPACAGKGSVPRYGHVHGVLSGRGFSLCRAQVPRQGCFSPKRGFFCAGGAVAPAFMTGKRGIFLRGCTLKAQNRHGRPFARRRDLPDAGVRGAQAPFFAQGGAIPHHRAVPRLFSSHAGQQRMFCLARMPLQGLFMGEGSCGRHPGAGG